MSNSVLERLERLPRIAVLLLGLALIAAIAWLDYVTGPKLLLNVFYLLPVMLVAWVTASTAYGLLAVLATFLVGPLDAYLDGLHLYTLPVAAWNAGMRTAVFCIVLVLLAELRKLVARLQEQSLTDELTGVANRRAFLEVAAREIERSRRYRHELSLAYLDIDGFKAVNDRFGHAVGDRVLIALAGLARATARSVDTVARIGGDEFVILMPETDARAAAAGRASARGLFAGGRCGRGAHHLQCRAGHLRARPQRRRGAAGERRRAHVRGQGCGRRQRAACTRGRGGGDGCRRPTPALRTAPGGVGEGEPHALSCRAAARRRQRHVQHVSFGDRFG